MYTKWSNSFDKEVSSYARKIGDGRFCFVYDEIFRRLMTLIDFMRIAFLLRRLHSR